MQAAAVGDLRQHVGGHLLRQAAQIRLRARAPAPPARWRLRAVGLQALLRSAHRGLHGAAVGEHRLHDAGQALQRIGRLDGARHAARSRSAGGRSARRARRLRCSMAWISCLSASRAACRSARTRCWRSRVSASSSLAARTPRALRPSASRACTALRTGRAPSCRPRPARSGPASSSRHSAPSCVDQVVAVREQPPRPLAQSLEFGRPRAGVGPSAASASARAASCVGQLGRAGLVGRQAGPHACRRGAATSGSQPRLAARRRRPRRRRVAWRRDPRRRVVPSDPRAGRPPRPPSAICRRCSSRCASLRLLSSTRLQALLRRAAVHWRPPRSRFLRQPLDQRHPGRALGAGIGDRGQALAGLLGIGAGIVLGRRLQVRLRQAAQGAAGQCGGRRPRVRVRFHHGSGTPRRAARAPSTLGSSTAWIVAGCRSTAPCAAARCCSSQCSQVVGRHGAAEQEALHHAAAQAVQHLHLAQRSPRPRRPRAGPANAPAR